MAQPQIDYDKAWEAFWPRFTKEAPLMREIADWVSGTFTKLWNDISPVIGLEETISVAFEKDGGLRTSMAGWLLIGLIAKAGANQAIDESTKILEAKLQKLNTKWENKLQAIENRLGPIEEWCGIKQPKED